MEEAMKPIPEPELRKLRARVFGDCTDQNWKSVRDNWNTPANIRWLKEKAKQPLRDYGKEMVAL